MTRHLGVALVVCLLLAPIVGAQIAVRPATREGPVVVSEAPTYAQLAIDSVDSMLIALRDPWLLVGRDNRVNLTVWNSAGETLDATFRVNVTGADASNETLTLQVPPFARGSVTFSLHPEDFGRVSVAVVAEDAFQPGGEPLQAQATFAAVLAPSIRLLDPAPGTFPGEDDEFRLADYSAPQSRIQGFARIRAGDTVPVRLEVHNPLEVPTPAFDARLAVTSGKEPTPIKVPSMEPGRSTIVTFSDFVPFERYGFDGMYYGQGPRTDVAVIGTFIVAGVRLDAGLAEYRLEKGSVVDVKPAEFVVQVQNGMAFDILVPKNPTLGVPTRVKYNLSNGATERARGAVSVRISTPGNLFYETQGPQTFWVDVDLAPGDRASGAFEFTPRVSGDWSVSSSFRSSQGYYGFGGGGGGFRVPGSVDVRIAEDPTLYARIGERLDLDIVVETRQTLQAAELRVTSGSGIHYDSRGSDAGAVRPGIEQDVMRVDRSSVALGELRPGGVVNATMTLVPRASGSYMVVAYVLSEGFAYVATSPDPNQDPGMRVVMDASLPTSIRIAVQPRILEAGWALMPLTFGLAFFVGVWTLRTRFVK